MANRVEQGEPQRDLLGFSKSWNGSDAGRFVGVIGRGDFDAEVFAQFLVIVCERTNDRTGQSAIRNHFAQTGAEPCNRSRSLWPHRHPLFLSTEEP